MSSTDSSRGRLAASGAIAVVLFLAGPALALQDVQSIAPEPAPPEATPPLTSEQLQFMVGNLWILIAAALVFVMHLGFACIESGLTRAKNTVNVLAKNVAIVAIGVLTYALIGFSLMYGEDQFRGLLGFAGLGVGTDGAGLTPAYNANYTYWSDFIFQAMFAATAATIVSGAVAERIRLGPFLAFATLFVALVYPVTGFWKWGGGWLENAGFHDFAGSTLVHAVGGCGALAGAVLLGPRMGKYVAGQTKAIMGHNLPLATVGMFLLWFGWYGFNGGSVLSADPAGVSIVFVTTTLAAAAGIAGATALSWLVQRKPDLSMMLNGALAGLVGVTAGADVLTPGQATIVGAAAGLLVVALVLALDRVRIDDPVGAISVHLGCGVWGTLAVGLFVPGKSLLVQLEGVGAVCALALAGAFLIFGALKLLVGIRVAEPEEQIGLDISEHGMEAYDGFQIFLNQ